MQYVWDPKKADANARKHGVTFQEAAEALEDPSAVHEYDLDRSDDEVRIRVTCWSPRGRLLFVVTVEWDADTTRIMSARKAKTDEEFEYAENNR